MAMLGIIVVLCFNFLFYYAIKHSATSNVNPITSEKLTAIQNLTEESERQVVATMLEMLRLAMEKNAKEGEWGNTYFGYQYQNQNDTGYTYYEFTSKPRKLRKLVVEILRRDGFDAKLNIDGWFKISWKKRNSANFSVTIGNKTITIGKD